MCEHHGAAANSRPLGRVPTLLSFFRSLTHRQNELLRYFFRSGPTSVFVQYDKVDRKFVTGLSNLKLDVKKSDRPRNLTLFTSGPVAWAKRLPVTLRNRCEFTTILKENVVERLISINRGECLIRFRDHIQVQFL